VNTEIVDLRTGAQLPKNKKETASCGSVLRPLYSKDQASFSHSESPTVFCILLAIIVIILRIVMFLFYRVVQKKIAQSLMCHHFATVCSTCSITQFSPKCS